jgi:maltodextrin utilization protein YvdJ
MNEAYLEGYARACKDAEKSTAQLAEDLKSNTDTQSVAQRLANEANSMHPMKFMCMVQTEGAATQTGFLNHLYLTDKASVIVEGSGKKFEIQIPKQPYQRERPADAVSIEHEKH